MRHLLALTCAGLALAACGLKTIDVAVMPPGTYGPGVDVDEGAIFNAEGAFNGLYPPPTDPAKLALSLASVEYLAGEYSAGGRWSRLNPQVQATMIQARDEIRHTLAVAPDAPSQQVVNSLLAVTHASGPDAQLAALSSPIYTRGAQATLDTLKTFPRLPQTEHAILYASHHLFDDLYLP